MRILPRRARLAGAGLLIAAVTIGAAGLRTLSELDREASLHREVHRRAEVKDSLDNLRTHLNELRAASRLVALTGDSEAFVDIERRAGEVETELDYLAERASADAPLPSFESLAPAARLLVVHARSIVDGALDPGIHHGRRARARSREAWRRKRSARSIASDAAVTARINDRITRAARARRSACAAT